MSRHRTENFPLSSSLEIRENFKDPMLLEGYWEGDSESVQISFQVNANEIQELAIKYDYGDSDVCEQLKDIVITPISSTHAIEINNGQFQGVLPAKYKALGIVTSNNSLTIRGKFQRNQVSGTLDFSPASQLNQGIPCLEGRHDILWEAQKK